MTTRSHRSAQSGPTHWSRLVLVAVASVLGTYALAPFSSSPSSPPAATAMTTQATPPAPPALQSAQSAKGTTRPDEVVARWAGGELRYADLQQHAKERIAELKAAHDRELYTLEQSALKTLMAQRIVQQEAERLGVSPEALLARVKVPKVTDAQKRAFFEENLVDEGVPFEKVKAEIAEHLKDEQRTQAIAAMLDELESQAGATLLLSPPPGIVADFDLDGRASLGPDDAKVTVVVFEDFECPFCAETRKTIKSWRERYPSDVRVVFMHFPLEFHAAAKSAAIAAECARRQGKFWPMYDRLFDHHDKLASGFDGMRPHGEKVGLDMTAFEACFRSDDAADRIEDDIDQAEDAGVEGTPSVFINGLPFDGVPSVSDLAQYVR